MDRLLWHKRRQRGIGGSDVGAILGVNRWKGAFQIYLEKTQEITEEHTEPNEAAYWGRNLEEKVAREFSKRTGKKVRRDNKHLVHKEYPFMMANICRRVVGENSILQCKTTSSFGAKEWKKDEIPYSYLLQCHHYLAVTGADKCYVAILIGGQKFLIKEIARDEEVISMIIEAEKDFWINHVEKRLPPPLDSSFGAEKYLKEKYPKSKEALEVTLKWEYKDKISQYLTLKDSIKALEEQAKTLENNIKYELGEAERGTVDNFKVYWKSVASNRIDSKVLKAKYPEVYKEVCKESVLRRFEIRESL
jgi:putative phage-type endonuclease